MRDHEAAFLEDIEAFIAEHGMSESKFGLLVVNDNKLVKRVRNGGVTLRTVTKIQDYMRQYRAKAAAE